MIPQGFLEMQATDGWEKRFSSSGFCSWK